MPLRSLIGGEATQRSLTNAKCDPTTGRAVNVSTVPFVVSYQSPKGPVFRPLEEYLCTDVIKRSRMFVELVMAAVHISQPRSQGENRIYMKDSLKGTH